MMVDSGKPIADYSDAEIRDALVAYGQSDVPAVTSLTRPILQRKLEKLQAGSSTVVQQQPTPGASEPAAVETVCRGESTRSDQENKPEGYYGVAAAPNEQSVVPLSPYYTSKREVLLAIKGSKLKGARFKRFESPQSAEAYSRHHGSLEAEAGGSSIERTDQSPQPGTPEAPLKTEKANSFPSLKQQNHTALRQLIETGDTVAFAKSVWENPRHLVTAGDAPEVLQPGNRYNALHCAVRKGQLEVCKELFSIVESDSFWKLLYPDDSEDVRQDRKRRLIDLYLNVPDKTGETALHLACKFGMEHIVSYLVTYPQLNVTARNGLGLTPAEAVRSLSPALKKRIIDTLQEPEVYYVPVLRTTDNSSPPSVGPPSRLTDSLVGTPPRSLDGSALCADSDDVISRAFAGPMSPSKAAEFYHEWRSPSKEKERHTHTRRTDSERGLERVGRHIAHQVGVAWSEYWDFLGCYTDLSKSEGMGRLEDYLTKFSSHVSLQMRGASEGVGGGFPPTSSSRQRPSSSIASAHVRAIPCKLFAEDTSEGRGTVGLEMECRMEAESSPVCLALPLPGTSSPPSSPQPPPLSSLVAQSPFSSSSTGTWADVNGSVASDVASVVDALSALHLGDADEGGGGEGKKGIPNELSGQTTGVCINGEAMGPSGASHHHLPRGAPNGGSLDSPGLSHDATPVFLAGLCPTKLDCDVKLALCDVEVDATKYPYVSRWLARVKSYSEQEQKSWPTPVSRPASVRPNASLPLSPLVFSSPPPPLLTQSPPLSRRTPRTPRVPRTTPVHHLSRSSMVPRLLV